MKQEGKFTPSPTKKVRLLNPGGGSRIVQMNRKERRRRKVEQSLCV